MRFSVDEAEVHSFVSLPFLNKTDADIRQTESKKRDQLVTLSKTN